MSDPNSDNDPSRSLVAVRRMLVNPFVRFLEIEASSGIVLAMATVAALLWVNVGSLHSYEAVWEWGPDLSGVGRLGHLDLRHFVDDGLMAIFFFVVGLEIKREWMEGALRDRQFARLPIVAAVGGMALPALLYTVFAMGTPAGHGWGIPMATDIAFVVGVMALLGDRVSQQVKVFLLTLAIVDDLGAIIVIALFYSDGLEWGWVGLAALGVVIVLVVRRIGVNFVWVYAVIGLAVWYATWQSGIHATIAGVTLAFVTPMQAGPDDERWAPVDYLLDRLHPWTSYLVVPVFALANAGVVLGGGMHGDGLRVALGIVVGLVVGKTLGVVGVSWLAVRARLPGCPAGCRGRRSPVPACSPASGSRCRCS